MNVLVINAGSSSLKASRLDSDGLGPTVSFEKLAPVEAVARAVRELGGPIDAVGHRFVHGGPMFTRTTEVTPEVRSQLESLHGYAPLHTGPSLEGLDAARQAVPNVPHVAVFDTQFHTTIPPAAATYAVPYEWTRDWHARRYGAHGLNHAYCARRAGELIPELAGERLVIAHLGNGCSLCAVVNHQSIDTTMGFTPLEGVMMGTRSGSIDPGLMLYAMRERGLTPEQLDETLNRKSGLLGVSGVSSDLRPVLAAATDERAKLALDVYVYRIRQAIGALTVSLGGLDALIFTAGVGEHSGEIRARVCADLGFLGITLDQQANAACRPDADIARETSRARVLVIAAREDLTIARETRQLLTAGHRPEAGGPIE